MQSLKTDGGDQAIHKFLSSPLCVLFNMYSASPSLTEAHLQCLAAAAAFLKGFAGSKENIQSLFKVRSGEECTSEERSDDAE